MAYGVQMLRPELCVRIIPPEPTWWELAYRLAKLLGTLAVVRIWQWLST